MTQLDRLFSMQELLRPIDVCAENTDILAKQLLNTMRENAELKAYPRKLICEKCNTLTDVKSNKDSGND